MILPGFLLFLFMPGELSAQGASLLPTAAAEEESSPRPLFADGFPAAVVDKVVVPVPGEIFAVMDKLGAPDWEAEWIAPPESMPAGRENLALSFGATVAEGFLAVQARAPEAVRDTGKRLLRLGSSLAVEDRVLPHYQSIIDATDRSDWRTVRREIDRAQQTVRQAMVDLKDADLALLVSLGGWLRGTDALTSLIAGAYSTDRAELLQQPDLVKHFLDEIEAMPEKIKASDSLTAAAVGLADIHRAMTVPENGQAATGDAAGAISVDAVREISAICHGLLGDFYLAQPKKNSAEGSDK